MKKITILAVAVVLSGLVTSTPARSEESGMLEISGNIVTVTGWQRGQTGKFRDATAGVLGDNLALPAAPGTEQFGFFVDQVEVTVAKSFGENIRFRTDLDFTPFNGAATPGRLPATGVTGTGDALVEQAYLTANIPAGNGWEVGFIFGNQQVFLGNFIHTQEATRWYAEMNREITTFNRKYLVGPGYRATHYCRFLQAWLYQRYYHFLDTLFNKYNSTFKRAVTKNQKHYNSARRNWYPGEKTPLLRAA